MFRLGQKKPEQKKAHVNSQGQTVVSANDLLTSTEVKAFMEEMSPKVDIWIQLAKPEKEEKK